METAVTPDINTILSNHNGRCIELLHRAEDPCVWIVRSSRKFFWFRLNSRIKWFMNKQMALAYAEQQQSAA